MPIADQLLPEFDHETTTTRSLLALVPADKFEWAPHPRSMTLHRLSGHLANLLRWALVTIERTELDMADPEQSWPPPEFSTTEQLLDLFDANRAAARAAIAAASDEQLMTPWTFRNGDHEVFTMVRAGVLRSFVFNHGVHHRGQLSVYLRLLEVPLPHIYGPTADTPM